MTQPTKDNPPIRPLVQALDQNDMVKEAVAHSANELLVANAVLQNEISGDAQTTPVIRALEKSQAAEERIQETVAELTQVNALLESEIDERIDLERKLLASDAALTQSKMALSRQIEATNSRKN